jgi:signal transduction histidine kinase
MLTSTRRLAIVFGCAIVLPTVVLAYLGITASQDDAQRIAAEQQRLGALCRLRCDQELGRELDVLRGISASGRAIGAAIEDLPRGLLRHVFVLDNQHRWVVPRMGGTPPVSLSSDFADATSVAQQLEFAAQDVARAYALHQSLASRSTNGAERAIALNAVARCARKLGYLDAAHSAYSDIIENHPAATDGSGSHLATFAHFQRAELHLASGNPGAAIASLADWVRALNRGAYPVQAGSSFDLDRAAELARSIVLARPDREASSAIHLAAEDLQARIRTTVAYLGFVQLHGSTILQPDLASSLEPLGISPERDPSGAGSLEPLGIPKERELFRAGSSGGEPYLIAVVPGPQKLLMGAQVDLPALLARMQSVIGQAPAQSDFHLCLLDDRAAAEFRRAHAADIATVVALSDRGIGLRLGMYADSDASIVSHYRGRRRLLLAAIALLSVTIGFGGYLLARDATRERRLSRLRSQFVSNVSHEFKTPLAAIRLFAETLLMGHFHGEAERVDCLETILHEGDRLSRLVDNVLEFSRIETGRKAYHLEEEDLAEIARFCLDLLKYRLRAEGFRAAVEIADDLPRLALDRDAVTQAVLNLLSNAIKYSADEKEVTLRVTDGGDHATVEVTDRGIGIPAHEHAMIFASFHRLDSDQLKASGAGLGLTIVKHVMDAHAGRVELESVVGQGSCFRLVFPRPPVE